jgi:opacity protein-like surface antigen
LTGLYICTSFGINAVEKFRLTKMKIALIAAAASVIAAPAAMAGPYVEIENNAGYRDGDYTAATTDFHVGYEGDISESTSYYVQGGVASVRADGEDNETEFSGKAGVGVAVNDNITAYGEVAFLTEEQTFDDDLNVGVKVGMRYSF